MPARETSSRTNIHVESTPSLLLALHLDIRRNGGEIGVAALVAVLLDCAHLLKRAVRIVRGR